MSAYEIGHRAYTAGVILHPFKLLSAEERYMSALQKDTEFTEGAVLPALPLYAHLVQSGDRAFMSLCRMALWLKRKIKDKDTSKEARRRMADTLDLVEYNIDYMKTNRKECDDFVQAIADNLWDNGATVAEARGWN